MTDLTPSSFPFHSSLLLPTPEDDEQIETHETLVVPLFRKYQTIHIEISGETCEYNIYWKHHQNFSVILPKDKFLIRGFLYRNQEISNFPMCLFVKGLGAKTQLMGNYTLKGLCIIFEPLEGEQL